MAKKKPKRKKAKPARAEKAEAVGRRGRRLEVTPSVSAAWQAVGRRIASLRIARGYSQTRLSEETRQGEEVGLHLQTICRIETGQQVPGGSALSLISKALRVKIIELFEE